MPLPLLVTFVAGASGTWRIDRLAPVIGDGLPAAERLAVLEGSEASTPMEAWWALAQDERRAIFEEQSRHIGVGLEYLPAVARRLHHSRELGEPFDFLTWFEYAPEHSESFEELVRRLRDTEEWRYVDREVDIRLTRVGGPQR